MSKISRSRNQERNFSQATHTTLTTSFSFVFLVGKSPKGVMVLIATLCVNKFERKTLEKINQVQFHGKTLKIFITEPEFFIKVKAFSLSKSSCYASLVKTIYIYDNMMFVEVHKNIFLSKNFIVFQSLLFIDWIF